MAIDFAKWNADFGGEAAVKEIKEAQENAKEYSELPDGTYVCKLEKLELGESKTGKPLVKGMFRIIEGEHKKQCLFYNGSMVSNNPQYNGFMKTKVLEFLRSLKVLDDMEIDFDGNYQHFNDLLLDIAEAADEDALSFEIEKSVNGDFTVLTVKDVFE